MENLHLVDVSIQGMPNITVTMALSDDEMASVQASWMAKEKLNEPVAFSDIPVPYRRRASFHIVKRRLAQQGADNVPFFPVN